MAGAVDTWLIFDVPNLAHRAFHALGRLKLQSAAGVRTGTLYGFLRDIRNLRKKLGSTRELFCFDQGPLLRERLYPGYKATRKKKWLEASDEDRRAREEVHAAVDLLAKEVLPELGYRNLFARRGFEADDLIAALVKEALPEGDAKVLAGSDSDLLQLLSDSPGPTSLWNLHSKRLVTAADFRRQWGLEPTLWSSVKALAGCGTDDVVGVKGVGEVLAARYLRGDMPKTHKVHARIKNAFGQAADNLRLVRLPFEGTPVPEVVGDAFDPAGWRRVCVRYDLESLLGEDDLPRGFGLTGAAGRANVRTGN